MDKFNVGFYCTIGGSVTIEATNKEDAEEIVIRMLDESDTDELSTFPNYKVGHREFDTVSVEKKEEE